MEKQGKEGEETNTFKKKTHPKERKKERGEIRLASQCSAFRPPSIQRGKPKCKSEKSEKFDFFEYFFFLHSLKWYKDDREFYSYVPRMNEGGAPRRFFPVPGLSVDVSTV